MTEPSDVPLTRPPVDSDEMSLLDLLVVLAKYKKLILGLPLLFGLIAAAISISLPNIYTSSAKILPPQQSQSSASAMLNQLGNVASLVGGAAGIKNPSDIYVGMLKSRTVADNLIKRFDLMKSYEVRYASQARKKLESNTNISAGKEGIITVEVDDKDPKRAADLANAYVDELLNLTLVLAVTEASQRRLFFERQLVQAKENLNRAEILARQALAQGGLVKVDDQGKAMVENTARLRAQITVKEVQIGAMRTFAADGNSDLRLAQRELESMKGELAKIEGVRDDKATRTAPTGQGIESLRLLRDVKYHETLFELLARQYELAKIDEAKDSAVIQVMDKGIEPDRKSKPWRTLIVLLSVIGGLFVAALCAFVREAMIRASNNPMQSQQLLMLRRYLSWR